MALIDCPECRKQMSDKAEACPHCGAPAGKRSTCSECGKELPAGAKECPDCGCPVSSVSPRAKNPVPVRATKQKKKKRKVWLWVVGIVVGLWIIGSLAHNTEKTDSEEGSSVTQEGAVTQEEKEQDPMTKFVGTYLFDYNTNDTSNRFKCTPLVVLPDGRCVLTYMTLGGDINPEYIGNVQILSDHAFRIVLRDWIPFELSLFVCPQGVERTYGSTGTSKWRTMILDINENRMYRTMTDYENRDISAVEYAKIVKHTESTSLTE